MENKTKFTEIGKWNDRLEMFGYDIMSLISLGESERVDDIIHILKMEMLFAT